MTAFGCSLQSELGVFLQSSTAFPGPRMGMEFLLCFHLDGVDPHRPSTQFEVLHSQVQVAKMTN